MISALISLLLFALIVCIVAWVVVYLLSIFITDGRVVNIVWIIAGLIILLHALKLFGLLGHAALS